VWVSNSIQAFQRHFSLYFLRFHQPNFSEV
jgi:hypothetical protein